MTTVVWKKGVLCADRLSTSNGIKLPLQRKLTPITHECAFVITGFSRGHDQFHRWILKNYEQVASGEVLQLDPTTVPVNNDISYVIAIGKKLWYTDNESLIKVHDTWFATGTGQCFASAALELGHSVSEAMQVAHKLDPYTSKEFDKWTHGAAK